MEFWAKKMPEGMLLRLPRVAVRVNCYTQESSKILGGVGETRIKVRKVQRQ